MTNVNTFGEPERFVARAAAYKGPMTGATFGLFEPGTMAEEELGDVDWSRLHSYMVRRFGLPNVGCDPLKDISCWMITTPMKGVNLTVRISPNNTRHLFGYMIDKALSERLYQEEFEKQQGQYARLEAWCIATHGRRPPNWDIARDASPEEKDEAKRLTTEWIEAFDLQDQEAGKSLEYQEAEGALRRTIRDLRRTVGVRDREIDLHGAAKESLRPVKASDQPARNYPDYIHTSDMRDIHIAIHKLGAGRKGIGKVVEILRNSGVDV